MDDEFDSDEDEEDEDENEDVNLLEELLFSIPVQMNQSIYHH